jgi:hypothetical protein
VKRKRKEKNNKRAPKKVRRRNKAKKRKKKGKEKEPRNSQIKPAISDRETNSATAFCTSSLVPDENKTTAGLEQQERKQ